MAEMQQWQMEGAVNFIQSGGYQLVALQFPDELLGNSAMVAEKLSSLCKAKRCNAQFYVLADSAFDSLSVDEVAASHVKADCIIHYGSASLTPASKTPCYFVFGMVEWNGDSCSNYVVGHLAAWVTDSTKAVVLLVDHPLGPYEDIFVSKIEESEVGIPIIAPHRASRIVLPNAADHPSEHVCGGLSWTLPDGLSMQDCLCVWVGDPESKLLFQLSLKYSSSMWVTVDASTLTSEVGLPSQTARLLRKRYYLVEKSRSAQIVGILVSTLAVGGFLTVAKRLKRLANRAGKKTYLMVIGKPSPYKLANFPEVDIFVMVCDPPSMILDSKEYLSPIITPYEAQMAFTNSFVNINEYQYAMEEEDPMNNSSGSHFSLVDGSLHVVSPEAEGDEAESIVVRSSTTLASVEGVDVRSAADYFSSKRQFKGMDANTSKNKAEVLLGRKGRAAEYSDEGS